MRKVRYMTLAGLAVAAMAFNSGGGIKWQKWEKAFAFAQATGKPIAVYSKVNSSGGGC